MGPGLQGRRKVMAECEDDVSLSWIAQFFHSLPHVNFDFQNTSSVFDPEDSDYQQALILYGLVPCLFGCLAVIILCGQFVASCCSAYCQCDKSRRCLCRCGVLSGWILCISTLICSVSIIAAFVFNDTVDQGVNQVSKSIGNVNDTLLQVQTKVVDIKSDLLDMEHNITDLQEELPHILLPIMTKLSELKTHVRVIIATVIQVKKFSLPNIDNYVDVTEYYRWWGTFGTLSLNTLTCILVFYAMLRKSICGFVLVIILGTSCLLLNWGSCGVDLGATIGMSDLCIDTESFILIYTPNPPVNEIVKYYINCTPDATHPYQKYVTNAKQQLEGALDIIAWLSKQSWAPVDKAKVMAIYDGLKDTRADLQVINNDFNCSSTRKDYQNARCALCSTVVPGLAQLLLVTLILGFFLIFLLVTVTPIIQSIPTDRRCRKKWNILFYSCKSADEETPYQSFSDSSSEAVPLLASLPPQPIYDAVHKSMEYQFHSCEDKQQGRRVYPGYTPNKLLNQSTQQPQAKPVITRPQTSDEINSMAF